jgi:ribosomal protein S8
MHVVNKQKKLIKISPLLFKKSGFFKGLKLISTPSKAFFINLKSLILLNKAIGEAIVIISTSKGLLTHKQAIRLGLGGKLICIIS